LARCTLEMVELGMDAWLRRGQGRWCTMTRSRNVYGEVENKRDLHEISVEIRRDVEHAKSREALTELHKRAGYLVTLTQSPSWKEKFGDEAGDLHRAAQHDFTTTAREINRRAKAIGTEADYDETWGE
jgi:hypothetical protein